MTNKNNIYTADEGKLIVRKADDFIMGDAIDLGSADSIENYEERAFTEEEIDALWEILGVKREETIESKKENNSEQNKNEE